jgi:A/G-specific adenine glycosylase
VLAQALVPTEGDRAWAFNQAVMELGALVCTARKPRCPECPVRADCLYPKHRPGKQSQNGQNPRQRREDRLPAP